MKNLYLTAFLFGLTTFSAKADVIAINTESVALLTAVSHCPAEFAELSGKGVPVDGWHITNGFMNGTQYKEAYRIYFATSSEKYHQSPLETPTESLVVIKSAAGVAANEAFTCIKVLTK